MTWACKVQAGAGNMVLRRTRLCRLYATATPRVAAMSKGSRDPGATLDMADPELSKRDKVITMIRPSVGAGLTVRRFNTAAGELPLTELVTELAALAKLATEGNTDRCEALLIAHAHSLDAIFNNLARRAADNLGGYPEAVERNLRLAFKAQAQCRATIEALINIKNPRPVAYVQQANIGHSVQVNNAPSSGESCESRQNELLEAQNGDAWLDRRAPETPSNVDPALAAVEKVHRTKDSGG